MVKKIIACSDIHIRNLRRYEEYQNILSEFIKQCKDIASSYNEGEVRIVVAGDILHNKLDISSEGYLLASWFFKQLDNIAKTIVIAGNHDMNMNNIVRLDPLSAIFSMCKFNQTIYLDKELNYSSDCLVDDNIVWCLYSSFDNLSKPNIEEYKINNPSSTFVALYHGDIKGSKTDVGYASESGNDVSIFDGVDFAILGHIHKRQCLTYHSIPILYCGSMIQQDHGENISGHGYVVWNVETQNYEEIDIPNNNFGFYTMTINSQEDIENDLEEVINL